MEWHPVSISLTKISFDQKSDITNNLYLRSTIMNTIYGMVPREFFHLNHHDIHQCSYKPVFNKSFNILHVNIIVPYTLVVDIGSLWTFIPI